MSKYHVIHGSLVLGSGEGDGAKRKTYEVGDSFDLSDEEAKPLLEAGTVGKGAKLKDGEAAPVTNPLASDDTPDHDAQRQAASDGAPEGSQDPKAAARDFKAQSKKV